MFVHGALAAMGVGLVAERVRWSYIRGVVAVTVVALLTVRMFGNVG